jgi:hypothetical protein
LQVALAGFELSVVESEACELEEAFGVKDGIALSFGEGLGVEEMVAGFFGLELEASTASALEVELGSPS